eukprot:gnl/TRDRNA2_/TRDRNA2_195748_c0_seq1.p1 gnl/TRDRNA2_/TRDRNA2_195748_c0~~gnl/TRDRNA2_/TRDRNA2_195748_c0_seq1.p1  ORF type:complete len:297 (-),score=47.73 gnl/TRDRNA2_/TRDRNA2_195748_c0_seq1:90-908(-)
MAAPEQTFQITRNSEGGGGFHVGLIKNNAKQSLEALTIAHVDADGPAGRAGMLPQHVGWHIVAVDGTEGSSKDCEAALQATRAPNRAFTLTARQPRTGEYSLEENSIDLATGTGKTKVHIDPADLAELSINLEQGDDGSTRAQISIPAPLVEAFGTDCVHDVITRALEEFAAQINGLRDELSEEEKASLEAEEREAATKDLEAQNDSERCVICMVNKRATVLLPCRHHLACHKCSVILHRRGRCHGTCPVCRQQISEVKSVSELKGGEYVSC